MPEYGQAALSQDVVEYINQQLNTLPLDILSPTALDAYTRLHEAINAKAADNVTASYTYDRILTALNTPSVLNSPEWTRIFNCAFPGFETAARPITLDWLLGTLETGINATREDAATHVNLRAQAEEQIQQSRLQEGRYAEYLSVILPENPVTAFDQLLTAFGPLSGTVERNDTSPGLYLFLSGPAMESMLVRYLSRTNPPSAPDTALNAFFGLEGIEPAAIPEIVARNASGWVFPRNADGLAPMLSDLPASLQSDFMHYLSQHATSSMAQLRAGFSASYYNPANVGSSALWSDIGTDPSLGFSSGPELYFPGFSRARYEDYFDPNTSNSHVTNFRTVVFDTSNTYYIGDQLWMHSGWAQGVRYALNHEFVTETGTLTETALAHPYYAYLTSFYTDSANNPDGISVPLLASQRFLDEIVAAEQLLARMADGRLPQVSELANNGILFRALYDTVQEGVYHDEDGTIRRFYSVHDLIAAESASMNDAYSYDAYNTQPLEHVLDTTRQLIAQNRQAWQERYNALPEADVTRRLELATILASINTIMADNQVTADDFTVAAQLLGDLSANNNYSISAATNTATPQLPR